MWGEYWPRSHLPLQVFGVSHANFEAVFESYVPPRFCREFVEICETSTQLIMFMATVLGEKPLMDAWVPTHRLDEFIEACRSYGLHARADSIFHTVDKPQMVAAGVLGAPNLTSTFAYGMPVESRADGKAHVFLAKDAELLRHGMWYPLAIRGRIIWPPRWDILTYGRILGYPSCCIDFFQRRNDWSRYSFLWEIYRNSQGRSHYLCNPLTKDTTYSYIYHMPCTFDCPATRERAERLRSALLRHDPELVERVDRHLVLPALVMYELKMYFFDGELRDGRLSYRRAYFAGGPQCNNLLQKPLNEGNELEVRGDTIVIFRDGEPIHRIPCQGGGFAPERPFTIQFAPP